MNFSGDYNSSNFMNFSDYNETATVPFNSWELTSKTDLYPIIVPIIFAIIFIIGVVGNGTLVVAVVANKTMRNVPNILIVSLALGDLLLILVAVPTASTYFTFAYWPLGVAVCKANNFIETLSVGVSVFTLTALSADRYVAIVNPMSKLTGRTQKTTMFIAVAIWVVSTFLAIPDLWFSDVVGGYMYCAKKMEGEENVYHKWYWCIHFVIFFILPMLTIGYLYSQMARILFRSNHMVPTESRTGLASHQRQIAARKKVACVVLAFVVIFIICCLPWYIYIMWWFFSPELFNAFWFYFKTVAFCLKFLNSCINPLALYFLSGQFRLCFNRYLFCCCRGLRYSSLSPSTRSHVLNSSRRPSPTHTELIHSHC